MADSSQENEEDSQLMERALPTGSALYETVEHLKRVNSEIRSAHLRIDHLAVYVAGGARFSDEQYRRASAEIIRIDTTVLPELEAQRAAALTMLIDAHFPISVHYR